ncbi:MAG: YbaB/EbfC family nucleoid-associated protein [Oscillospiraceae bacterium]|nr:YbaB/EbfC family nucleoid-associated protein [Oscillospiraceae bacterium]
MKARLPQEYTPKGSANMMKQLQKMQTDMSALNEELAVKQYTASSGGSMVEATVTGDKMLVSLDIKPEVVDPDDIEMLTDLVVAAIRQAQDMAEVDAENQMSQIAGGVDLPGLF